MTRTIIGVGAVAAVIIMAALGWFYRPWAEYSPSKVLAFSGYDDRAPVYRAMEDVFPYREIAASPNVVVLPRDLRELDIQYTFEGKTRTLDDYAAEHPITSMMVVKDGKVILERYWRGEGPEDRHTSWSVAKSYIATMIGIGLHEGKIENLDDPIEKYASIYQGTDYGKVTLRHALMMSSGIDFNESYEVKGSDIRKLFFNTFFLNKDIDTFVRSYKQANPAGDKFDYISTNTAALGAVISGAYGGRSLASIAEEKIFAPNGMDSATWLTDRKGKKGKELAYCCLNTRLEDYAKFGLFYLHDGVVGGNRLFPEGWVKFISTPPTKDHYEGAKEQGKLFGYGHHFWVPFEEKDAFMAVGYNGQYVRVNPNENIVMAMTSADTNLPGSNVEVAALHHAVILAAMAAE